MQSSRLESDNPRSFLRSTFLVPLASTQRESWNLGGIDTAEVFIDFREKIFHATCFFK